MAPSVRRMHRNEAAADGEASIPTENLEQKAVASDDRDPRKAIMGGSVRGLLLLLLKKMSLKAIMKKKAFLTIGGTANAGADSDFVSKAARPTFLHSRAVGKLGFWL